MNNPEFFVFGLFASIAAIAALTIWFGLRTRTTIQQGALSLTAGELLKRYPEINPGNFLYALRQDFSNTTNGFLIRDAQDNEVAKIYFHPVRRDGFIEIEAENKRYTCDSLFTWWMTITLKENEDKQPICVCRKKIFRRFYSMADGRHFQIDKTPRAILTDRYKIKNDNITIGELRPINEGALQKGIVLNIPPRIPLHIRLFFLSTI